VLIAVVLAGVVGLRSEPAAQAVPCDTPLTEDTLKELVSGGVPPARIRQLISTCGVDLGQVEGGAAESRLRAIGVPAAALTALAPPAGAAVGAAWTSPIDRRRMVFIPAGTMRMGSAPTEPGRDADENLHDVRIAEGFWIDVDEVTNDAFRRFIISRPEWQKANANHELVSANYLSDWQGTMYPEGRANAAVVWVGWHAARAYAAWAGKRLPTEAEWEYAARAGTTTRYWWGDEFQDRRVGTATASSTPEQLQLRTNPWGVRDILGGVWEWTTSAYRPYPYVSTDGREDVRTPGERSIRGGSSANGESFLRVANRSGQTPSAESDLLGFRCVR
jgi:formylglycine-generating enzyme required for sulfatase activity